ncbi:MAG TPA: aminotransferase class V-fold PLP-dependent enzyme [Solirubrobacteraceae bacterium]|nr:aminotransferase class V-fold PLP-dependent enzyme [Solirubrobacteraceae bacterium]
MPDPVQFRAQFPVLERLHYLNAGTEGPLSRRAADAVRERIELETGSGRAGKPYFEGVMALAQALREAYARIMHCEPGSVALTGSTTDGVNTVIGGLDWSPGDEVVTSDEEHPGLLGPLARIASRFGVTVTVAPFAEVAAAVGPRTRLIATSHVSWASGRIIDSAALRATGVPFLLDAAQGIGAVPVDVAELGCRYYAASGQKWLSGPEGSGCLYVAADALETLSVPWPGYGSFADPGDALHSAPAEGAKRFDLGFPPGMRSAWALASIAVLEDAGLDWVTGRAADLAAGLADALAAHGLRVVPRDRSTLVSWHSDDADADVARLAEAGFIVRSIPSHGYLRASVGAWCSEEELAELAELAALAAA